MGMFDFFTNKLAPASPVRPGAQILQDPRRQMLQYPIGNLPASNAVPQYGTDPTASSSAGYTPNTPGTYDPSILAGGGTGLGTAATNSISPRPSLVPPPPAAYTPQQRLALQQARTRQLMDTTGDPVYDADGNQIGGRVVNQDHGIGGRLKDIFREAIISAGEQYNNTQGTPEQKLMSAIGGGLAGGFGGGFKPTLNEERQRLYDINQSQQKEAVLQNQIGANQGIAMKDAQIGVQQSEPQLRAAQIMSEVMKDNNSALAQRRADLIKQLDLTVNSGGYDPKTNAQLAADLESVGIHANTPLAQGAKYYGSWSPDGHFSILNTTTGDATLGFGGQAMPRPTTLSDADLGDARFPFLKSDAEIKRQATSELAPSLNMRDADPSAMQTLLNFTDPAGDHPYRKPDGTFNMDAYLADSMRPIGYSTLFPKNGAAIQSQIAKRELELTEAQKGSKADVVTLRSYLKGKTPAVADQAIGLFNQAYQEPNTKKRKAAITALFKALS